MLQTSAITHLNRDISPMQNFETHPTVVPVLSKTVPSALDGFTEPDPAFWSKTPSLPLLTGPPLLLLWRRFPSSFRILIYKALRWFGKKLYPRPRNAIFGVTTQRLPFNLYCKYRFVDRAEILAMMFVAKYTTIPVPRILDVVVLEEGPFVLMTQLPGRPCQEVVPQMDGHSRDLLKDDLHDWVTQLRNLPIPPSITISNFLGGASLQHRLSSSTPVGPFSTTEALHEFILSHLWSDNRADMLEIAWRRSYSKPHRLCFTHGDLRPWNVLVHNGRLSGLVDFGSSGWFPEYWELATATCSTPLWWRNMFFRILPQYQDEIEVEDILFSVPSMHPEMW